MKALSVLLFVFLAIFMGACGKGDPAPVPAPAAPPVNTDHSSSDPPPPASTDHSSSDPPPSLPPANKNPQDNSSSNQSGTGRTEHVKATLTFSPIAGKSSGDKSFKIKCDSFLRRSTDAVCVRLANNFDLIRPTSETVSCTQIFGGDQKVNVEGVVNGQNFSALLTREDGCAIKRWDRWTEVLGRPLMKKVG